MESTNTNTWNMTSDYHGAHAEYHYYTDYPFLEDYLWVTTDIPALPSNSNRSHCYLSPGLSHMSCCKEFCSRETSSLLENQENVLACTNDVLEQCLRDFVYPQTWEWVFICMHSLLFTVGFLGNALVSWIFFLCLSFEIYNEIIRI